MSDPLKHVQDGQPMKISARTFNTVLDMAKIVQRRKFTDNGPPINDASFRNLIKVKNDSGSDVDRFGVLGIDAPLILPSEDLDEFQTRIFLSCVSPSAASHRGQFVVCLDAIPDGETGRAFAYGVCPAYVNVNDASHMTCDVKNSDATQLDSMASGGSARILWKESGTGSKWCEIRIGDTAVPHKVWGNFDDPLSECDASVSATATKSNPPGISGTVTLYNDGGFIGADGGWFVASEDSDGRLVIDNCQCTIPVCE